MKNLISKLFLLPISITILLFCLTSCQKDALEDINTTIIAKTRVSDSAIEANNNQTATSRISPDSTVGLPIKLSVESKKVALQIAQYITSLTRGKESELAYNEIYKFSIKDNLGGTMKIQGKKMYTERKFSDKGAIAHKTNKKAILEFNANNFTFHTHGNDLQINSGQIEYSNIYEYSSRMSDDGKEVASSSTSHTIAINAPKIRVTLIDTTGVIYADTIGLEVQNIGADLNYYNVILSNSRNDKFSFDNIEL